MATRPLAKRQRVNALADREFDTKAESDELTIPDDATRFKISASRGAGRMAAGAGKLELLISIAGGEFFPLTWTDVLPGDMKSRHGGVAAETYLAGPLPAGINRRLQATFTPTNGRPRTAVAVEVA